MLSRVTTVISQAVADLEASTERRAGYALDFGVLDSGRTALIEYNDGFALGLYHIAPNDYFDLLWVRWQELVQATTRRADVHHA